MSTTSAAVFSRREFLIYEQVMSGSRHDQAASDVEARVAQQPGLDLDEQLTWARWLALTAPESPAAGRH